MPHERFDNIRGPLRRREDERRPSSLLPTAAMGTYGHHTGAGLALSDTFSADCGDASAIA